ncbi:MAG: DNA-directed RNA polymerase III subunit RPC1 [Amphiamblys sp. WSBS2006]|nr:MAG: DNA-directed RNA polymerase III subunit RPC1 [Amphiamblys sp. WSBS2006]
MEAMSRKKIISKITFGVLSTEQILNMSETEIFCRDLYNKETHSPMENGCLDRRLGVSDRLGKCTSCGKGVMDCPGHFGHIKLSRPVFHIGFFRKTLDILQSVCKQCGSILLSEETKIALVGKMKRRLDKKTAEKIAGYVKKEQRCFSCHYPNGLVKKGEGLGFLHIRSESKRKHDKKQKKKIETLNPCFVLNLFQKIKDIDIRLLGMDPAISRPESLVITHLPVPPACIRPSVQLMSGDGTNEDDLTIKLADIVFANTVLKNAALRGENTKYFLDDWEFLQTQCCLYINSNLPGVQSALKAKVDKGAGIIQRLSGKRGRFRGNLSGKRADFTSRTVISPDPNLRIGEVGVPFHVAKILTYPEKVTETNCEKMRRLVENGIDVHPGANYIQKKNGVKIYLKYGKKNIIAGKLEAGDVVERHLQTGDIVLFNRQPSLHRMSIMAHRAVVLPHNTFRFNPCECSPFNADFDGDEMNIHFPQTVGAMAEAKTLLGTTKNIISPRSGQVVISPLQDIITAVYLLTSKDVFYTREEFGCVCGMFSDGKRHAVYPRAAVVSPKELWTGKQVIGALLRLGAGPVPVFLETRTRSFGSCNKDIFHPIEGYFVMHGGDIMQGRLDKTIVGGDAKETSMVYHLEKEMGGEYAAECLSRLARLAARWLSEIGFSVGIEDVMSTEKMKHWKGEMIKEGYRKCEGLALDTADGNEGEIRQTLNKIREDMGRLCVEQLARTNPLNIMQECGSKGSKINIAQMVGCVGQQVFGGERVRGGYTRKTLSQFPDTSSPSSCGFVRNSFYDGLTPTEFFFHAVSGREGLVDTAVKTAETGYMQRRLMKVLEDFCVQYDGTVRDSEGTLVQYRYGEDGTDPMETEYKSHPINFATMEKKIARIQGSPLTKTQKSRTVQNTKEKYNECFFTRLSEWASKSELNTGQLRAALETADRKYDRSRSEPGTPCGAIAGQSIGEPGTQMTLKTFHFAGVASMNITQGVPRLKEIINGVRNISTPITVLETHAGTLEEARRLKGVVGVVYLRDILHSMTTELNAQCCEILLSFNTATIEHRRLSLSLASIKNTLLTKRFKLKKENIEIVDERGLKGLRIRPDVQEGENILAVMNNIARQLPDVRISRAGDVKKTAISEKEGDTDCLVLFVEGGRLSTMSTLLGVRPETIKSNDVLAVEEVFGVEAARETIIKEITTTMNSHGISVDPRHVMLLADTMTQKGNVLGITRFGIAKMKESVLMLSSFEKTAEHLFSAGIGAKTDNLLGVSESVIVGKPGKIGTGLFSVLSQPSA